VYRLTIECGGKKGGKKDEKKPKLTKKAEK
jgi:hypothetical protein